MKKILFTCFLALLCLFGSSIKAQVACSPPGVDLVDCPGLPALTGSHRGGDARSDTFYSVTAQDINGGPFTVDCGLKTVDYNKMGFSFVDDSISLRQGSLGSPATGEAMIYGEIINPDSLSPLLIEFRPYYLDGESSFMVERLEPVLLAGETFDGVMNPLVRKFTSGLEMEDRPGYFSILLGGRTILSDFLVLPGDRLKVELDLRELDVLFGGENAAFYEAQYAIAREGKRLAFDGPRQLVAKADSRILSTPGNLEKWEHFKGEFGSKLLVMSPGKESLDYLLLGLKPDNPHLLGMLDVLENYRSKLDEMEYELLKAEIHASVRFSVLTTFRKFHYPEFDRRFSESERASYRDFILDSFLDFPEAEIGELTRLVSKEYLNYALEKCMLMALFEGKSLLQVVDALYSGEMAEKLKTAYLSNYLSQLPNQPYVLEKYLAEVSSSPYRERIESLKRSHVPGGRVEPVNLVTLSGKELTEMDLQGKPTLLYFYFSSCPHSASYFKEYLFPLYQEVKDKGVRLIAVSVDEDPELWKSRIDTYSDSSLLNVNLRGESKRRWKEVYEIHGYPKVMFLDRDARILSFDIRTLGEDQESLIQEFKKRFQSELD
ncbi:TlpA family protein disulfide reductase [Algoriphagus pacificus]|uniref:TlpA family protein disulfide reductase n=1 Tax=Algoriphagus pacificus TaxID=2811234 RepID=A0ABS3CL65_9BACT|nr:TlpA disulfide reductase family protein [Algoriphagus pacificus]MBN7816916.1 TlpA family protein disulfide reductase [Algoriphagus pacificus]